MEQICRLCCSTKFVNNYIFDEGTALYWKLSLYLPIKVIKDDQLPQKICDKCSCKVNDIYQFCNETIEVQNRLRSMLIEPCITNLEMVDLTLIKPASSPPPLVHVPMQCQPMHRQREQSTQTDSTLHSVHKPDQCTQTDSDKPCLIPKLDISVKIKQEVDVQSEIHVVKVEEANYNNMYDTNTNIPSDSSDNVSLINLKKKKTKKLAKNGEIKKSKKQKPQKKEWEMFMNALPEGIGVGSEGNGLGEVKQELGCPTLAGNLLSAVKSKGVKTEVCDIDIFNCCICFEQCYSRSEMLQHYKQHKRPSDADEPAPPAPPPPASLKCPRCSKSVSAAEWTSHWRRHWERDHRPFRCALCEKAFRDHTQILKHGLTHKLGADGLEATQLPDKRYICDLCPEAFVYMRYLLSHRARAHPEALGRALALRCALCARHFAHLNSLRRHLRAHSGERSHLCSVCGKALSSREHLKFHIRIHTGYKPNVCKTCGKGFVKKCNLTLHERVHSGEKPHVCATCGKAFSQRSTLVIHERYHSGARPYACALCGRGFVAKGLLSMHLKTTCI